MWVWLMLVQKLIHVMSNVSDSLGFSPMVAKWLQLIRPGNKKAIRGRSEKRVHLEGEKLLVVTQQHAGCLHKPRDPHLVTSSFLRR